MVFHSRQCGLLMPKTELTDFTILRAFAMLHAKYCTLAVVVVVVPHIVVAVARSNR